MKRRQAIGIGVAVVITLGVIGAVWRFGVIPAPTFASLADRPDKSIPGTLVFVHHDDEDDRSCIQSTPAGGGHIREIVCRSDGRGLQLEADSEGRLLVRNGAYPAQAATAYEPSSGAVLERNVVIDGAGAPDTAPGDRLTPVAPRPQDGSGLAADGSIVEVSGCGGDKPGVEITGRDAHGGEVTILSIRAPRVYCFDRITYAPVAPWFAVIDSDDRLLVGASNRPGLRELASGVNSYDQLLWFPDRP